MRVLIAEDERITRATLTRFLEKAGHEVVAAENGREALERFESGTFDIVLTDWEMPELSGVELIRRIRELDRPQYVYVIMLTSRSDKGDIVNGIEAGADDFLSKPFDREELRVRLLSGERVVTLERRLSKQNDELRKAGERMSKDLQAAARVQRAMLPKRAIETPEARTLFVYVPTDELAGDGLGFHLVGDRYLVSYVVDVTGHGVPAALLAVTAMRALAPSGNGQLAENGDGAPDPGRVVTALNKQFCAGDNDGRFLTMLLTVLDLKTGAMRFSRAGHPLPVVVRKGETIEVSQTGGLPLGIMDVKDYPSVEMQLEPGDRVYLYSDGIPEQMRAGGGEMYNDKRVRELLISCADAWGDEIEKNTVDELAEWAGTDQFDDDVSLVAIEWAGP